MADVRFGIVGYGNIGKTHCTTLTRGAVEHARLTAVVTRATDPLPEGVKRFDSLDALLAADAADVLLIAAPTMSHPELGNKVLNAGRHLVMEKPVAMSLLQARQLVDAVPAGTQAAVMLNQRYHPVYQAMKAIIDRGVLGRIVRFNWIMTAWYRPDVYFQVSRWRGTWPGEGGGALLNQCIHNLDVLYWLLGSPESVVADARFGKFHDIDVEDEVSALLTYSHGLTGVVVASTGEAPGLNRFDLVGDLGSLSFDGASLKLVTSTQRVSEHCASTTEMFGVPVFTEQPVEMKPAGNQHACVLQNVVDAVLDGVPLATPLREGLGSIELANAMLLSAWEDRRVSLPLDAAQYQARLNAQIAGSGFREPRDIDVQIDMESSYR